MQYHQEWMNALPFIGMVAGNGNNGTSQIIGRLIEAAIIGGVIMYGTTRAMEQRMEGFRERLGEQAVEVRTIRAQLVDLRILVAETSK